MKKAKILRLITAILVVAIPYVTGFSFLISPLLGACIVLAIIFVILVLIVYDIFLEGVFNDKENKQTTNNDEKQDMQ